MREDGITWEVKLIRGSCRLHSWKIPQFEDVGASKDYDLVMKLLGNTVPSDGVEGGTILPIQESAYWARDDNLIESTVIAEAIAWLPKAYHGLFTSPNGTTMEGWSAEDLRPYDTNKIHPPHHSPFGPHWILQPPPPMSISWTRD